jgi:chromosome segregation protein
MHLKTIKLRGFKSFADATELRLEPGVAVVVGPNGSGKSNISDAILWATGSLSPGELRAEKADDVLFAGSAKRGAADFCEVELVFDNESGSWPELPFAEVSLCRRLHRGGEGQYLINRAAVRRIDLVELLSDVGLGGGLRSVISQGSVEAVLGARPAERRALVEEAAGLGRFKLRRHRAELKLARVAAQVERAADLEAEVRKRLRPLALQATAAERAIKLAHELARTEAALASIELAELEQRRERLAAERGERLEARARTEASLASLVARRVETEESLTDAAGTREGATAALYRLRACADRVELRREAAGALIERTRTELAASTAAQTRRRQQPTRPSAATLGRLADEAARLRDDLAARARLARERLDALDRSLAQREGLPPAARTLAQQGERLALSVLDVEPGHERAVAAALGHRASALLARDGVHARDLIERARSAGLGSLVVLVGRDPRELVAELELVALEELLGAERPAVTAEGIGWDPHRGELWFAGETAEVVLLELEASRRSLAAEVDELARRAQEAARAAGEASAAAAEVRDEERPRAGANLPPELLARLLAAGERLVALLPSRFERLEAPLRARVEADAERASTLGSALRSLGAEEAEFRRQLAQMLERLSGLEVELARLDAVGAQARRRLADADADPVEGDRSELEQRLARLVQRRAQLGEVNPLAKEEYALQRERLDELTSQRADLVRSLEELEQLRRELTETVEQRFAETYGAVERHFNEVVATLFPGGEGRLRLVLPDEEGQEPGIEVELRPAGKRVTRLSLLSGGEKALGAVAFLFSLFLARPSPFYLLDEVEAALDDTNIGRFTSLLRSFASRAQFIVVTHQKRTMEAADILYGVTMGAEGVSQVLSRRLPFEVEQAKSA